MTAGYWRDVPAQPMTMAGARDVTRRVLISPQDGWDGWVMRAFELAPGGHTPRHAHKWPHINVGLEGSGIVEIDGVEHPLRGGSYAFVPPGSVHQFRNTGTGPMGIICIVPLEGDPQVAD